MKVEEIKEVIIDFNFDDEKIQEYVTAFEPEEKYKDLAAYQW